jgi:hypothetical protein
MPRGDSRGDSRIEVDGQVAYIEVKRADSKSGARQVRAIKFIPVVAWSSGRGARCWAVLPADEVAKIVVRHRRGMHTELPLECSGIATREVRDRFWHCKRDLPDAVVEAVRESRRHPHAAAAMRQFTSELRLLRDRQATALLEAFRNDDPAFQYQLGLGEVPG